MEDVCVFDGEKKRAGIVRCRLRVHCRFYFSLVFCSPLPDAENEHVFAFQSGYSIILLKRFRTAAAGQEDARPERLHFYEKRGDALELSELTAYAGEKFHMQEQRKWADFPGFSVLADPDTGKWAALLMRQWDFDTGMEIQRCDIKCGRQILSEMSKPYLSSPFRMRGQKWIGVIFDDSTEPDVVFRLFDRAVNSDRQGSCTIVLQDAPAAGEAIYRDTAIPPAGARTADKARKAYGTRETAGAQTFSGTQVSDRPQAFSETQESDRPQTFSETGMPVDIRIGADILSSPEARTDTALPDIPARIRSMQRLYMYGNGSFAQKCRNFCRQGRFMEDYEDDAPWNGVYRRYFPTYHDLNIRQLRGYFTWRTRVRKGDFSPISTSLAYLYLYELLNGIGAGSPEDALEKMEAFEAGFLDSGMGESGQGSLGTGDLGMRRNLRRWMLEYAIIHNIPASQARRYADPSLLERDAALTVLKNPEDAADEEIFSALCCLAGKKQLEQSPIVKKYGERGKRLFAAVWRSVSEAWSGEGRDFFSDCFGEQKAFSWHPLANAIYWEAQPHPDADYMLDACRTYHCRGGIWQEKRYDRLYFDRKRFQGLLREADRMLRRYLKTGHYLQDNSEEGWAAPYVEAVIAAERQAELEARRPKITIDLSHLDQIRQDALHTRDSLLTEEEMEEGMDYAHSDGELSAAPAEENLPEKPAGEEIREGQAERADREKTESPVSSAPDRLPSGADSLHASDFLHIPDSIHALDSTHAQLLLDLLQGKPVEETIKARHLMPSVVADTINGALFDEIGDNVLECDGSTITVVEDYREDILQLLGGD